MCLLISVCSQSLSGVQLFVTLQNVARRAPLSMGFSRQECWSKLPFPSPGDLSDPGIEPRSPALAGGCFTTEPPGKFVCGVCVYVWYMCDVCVCTVYVWYVHAVYV